MNHYTVGGCYTYAVTPIVVLDRRFFKAIELCGHVVDQVLAFIFLVFFCVRSLHMCTLCLNFAFIFLKNSNLRSGNVFFGGISTIMQIIAHFGVKKCGQS